MQIEDSFRVDLPVDEAWRVLLDIERIAPCLPGAQLQEVDGEEYRGVVKVKVGPITTQYKGAARLTEVDDGRRRAVISASGRDTRGAGNASATITVSLAPDADGTRVGIDTDLSVTGKVAQFGRGVLADVSAKLLAQFVTNLERDVLTPAEPALDVAALEAEEMQAGATEVPGPGLAAVPGASGNGTVSPATSSGPRRIDAPPSEPVDLLAMSGSPLLRRMAPVLTIVAAVLLIGALRRRHRRRVRARVRAR